MENIVRMILRGVAVTGLTLLLPACATQTLRPEDAGAIRQIALAGPANPAQYNLAVGDLGGAIMMGTAVGAGAAAGTLAGSMTDREKAPTFTAAMAAQHLALGDELAAAISQALSGNGYAVHRIAPARRRPEALLDGNAELTAGDDALLDLAIEKSTYERRVWGKIGPSLTIRLRLTEAHTARVLLQKTYRYDLYSATIGYTILRPPPEYGFADAADVMADPPRAAAGFRAVIPLVVADLVAQLPKH